MPLKWLALNLNIFLAVYAQDLAFFHFPDTWPEDDAPTGYTQIPIVTKPPPTDISTSHGDVADVLKAYNLRGKGAAKIYYYVKPEPTSNPRRVYTYRTRRPKFVTQKRNDSSDVIFTSPKSSEVKEKVNSLLKNYLGKLYSQKYGESTANQPVVGQVVTEDPNGYVYKSKFFDGDYWNFKNKTMKLKKKFLSIFQIVQFPNSVCQASNALSDYQGICYHKTECDLMNGTALGNCAEGYGVCCVFRGSCGGSSSQNCTYFESPNYPNFWPSDGGVVPPTTTSTMAPNTPDPRVKYKPFALDGSWDNEDYSRQDPALLSCSFQIYKTNSDVQQMRIDFVDLELRGPTNGNCVSERLIISGQSISPQVPPICGYNTGQHVYVDVSNLNGPLSLSVLSNMAERKRFKIRICQIPSMSCNSSPQCLQYYTGVTGVVSSFNYDQSSFNRSSPGYFNNLNYAICIRREAGYCSITYTNVMNGIAYPFEINNLDENGRPTLPPGQAGAEIFDCPDDYIIINGIRLCGTRLNDGSVNSDPTMNAPVTDNTAGPIIIPVRTNGAYTGRGFKLFYTQNRCIN